MDNILVATVHGRFQLLHLDHLEYILMARSRCRHLIIGITSYNIHELVKMAEAPHRFSSYNNPLTYYERTEMITLALIEAGIDRSTFSFSPFPIETPEILPDFIPISFPCFTTIREEWNRKKIKRLQDIGYEVIILKEELHKEIEGTKVRQMIMNNDDSWKKLVPNATIQTVEKLQIRKRLIRGRSSIKTS